MEITSRFERISRNTLRCFRATNGYALTHRQGQTAIGQALIHARNLAAILAGAANLAGGIRRIVAAVAIGIYRAQSAIRQEGAGGKLQRAGIAQPRGRVGRIAKHFADAAVFRHAHQRITLVDRDPDIALIILSPSATCNLPP